MPCCFGRIPRINHHLLLNPQLKKVGENQKSAFAPLELCHPKRVWRGCWISMVFCTWWLLLPTTWECTLPPLLKMFFLRLNLELDDEHRWTVCSGWLFRKVSTTYSPQFIPIKADPNSPMRSRPATAFRCHQNLRAKVTFVGGTRSHQRSQGETFKSLLFFGRTTHGYTWDVSKFGTARQS